jgi:hypothetical protein
MTVLEDRLGSGLLAEPRKAACRADPARAGGRRL